MSASKIQIGKILAVGRNYADHIKELQNSVPKRPFFFQKPSSSIVWPNQGPILRPEGTNIHYELELAIIMGKQLKATDPALFTKEQALDHIHGYALALDMTARNVQAVAKSKGLPWTIAKGFDTFLPLSDIIPKSAVSDPQDLLLKLKVNNEVKQNDNTNLMLFQIPYLLSYISNITTLEAGDVILTGTPKGVGETVPGDVLEGELSSNNKKLAEIKIPVASRKLFIDVAQL